MGTGCNVSPIGTVKMQLLTYGASENECSRLERTRSAAYPQRSRYL